MYVNKASIESSLRPPGNRVQSRVRLQVDSPIRVDGAIATISRVQSCSQKYRLATHISISRHFFCVLGSGLSGVYFQISEELNQGITFLRIEMESKWNQILYVKTCLSSM